jgi:hypothetical protein
MRFPQDLYDRRINFHLKLHCTQMNMP